jgi:acyl-CoA reductase-like NAD-dependent aldehyde dehydrogenase
MPISRRSQAADRLIGCSLELGGKNPMIVPADADLRGCRGWRRPRVASPARAVEEHVRDSVAKGAAVVTGGRRRPGLGPLFYEPTILTDFREDMRVYAEETFGPRIPLQCRERLVA